MKKWLFAWLVVQLFFSGQSVGSDVFHRYIDPRAIFAHSVTPTTKQCQPQRWCLLELGDDEVIKPNGLHLSNSEGCEVFLLDSSGGAKVLVKPSVAAPPTHVVAITNKRIFESKLVADQLPTDAINLVPETFIAAGQRMPEDLSEHTYHRSSLNFGYHFPDCTTCELGQPQVFDNGKRTFIYLAQTALDAADVSKLQGQIEPYQPPPLLLLITEPVDNELVQYQYFDGLYIVDSLFNKAMLVSRQDGAMQPMDRLLIERVL